MIGWRVTIGLERVQTFKDAGTCTSPPESIFLALQLPEVLAVRITQGL